MGRQVDPKLRAIRRVLAGRFQQKRASVDFWGAVDAGGWGRKTTDHKKVKNTLLGLMGRSEANQFEARFRKLQHDLQRHLNAWERKTSNRLPVGDDSFDDLTSHIIGMGRKEYESVLRDPALALERAVAPYGSKDGYSESFAYAIPDEADYKVNLSRYEKWAKKAMREYMEASKYLPSLRADVGRIAVILSAMADGDYEVFLSMARQAKETSQKIEKEYHKALDEGRVPMNIVHAEGAVSNKWVVWNLLSELHEFLSRKNLIKRTASDPRKREAIKKVLAFRIRPELKVMASRIEDLLDSIGMMGFTVKPFNSGYEGVAIEGQGQKLYYFDQPGVMNHHSGDQTGGYISLETGLHRGDLFKKKHPANRFGDINFSKSEKARLNDKVLDVLEKHMLRSLR